MTLANVIAEVKQECLAEEIKRKWGLEYYQHKPLVLSGELFKALKS